MSEFSESYHLKADTTHAGVSLLQRAGLSGFVFSASNGWVTVLPEGEPFSPNAALISANDSILLYYMNAEDHGWAFAVYVNAAPQASYSCAWDESIQVQQPLDIARFETVVGPVLSPLGAEKLRTVFEPRNFEELFETAPAYAFAEAVGLKNFEWISFEYLMTDKERGESNFESVIFVARQ
jgi:hypothetical protein